MHDGKYSGFVSKSRVFAYYQEKLIERSLEST